MHPKFRVLRQLRKWVKQGNKEKIIYLWKRNPELIQLTDVHGKTALHYAAEYGQEVIVHLLLSLGATPYAQAQSPSPEHPAGAYPTRAYIGQTALHFASASGHLGIVIMLLQIDGIEVERRDSSGRTAFLLAVMMGRKTVIKELTKSEIDMAARDCYGWGALHLAAIYDHEEVLVFLLAQATIRHSINNGDNFGNTPLHYGVMYGHTNIIKVLLAQTNILINVRNSKQQTPLLLGVAGATFSDVRCKLIADDRVDLTVADQFGNTLLHLAVSVLDVSIVRVLTRQREVNIDVMNFYRQTPLEVWISLKPILQAQALATWTEIKKLFWERYLQDGKLAKFIEIWIKMCSSWMREDGIVCRSELKWVCVETKQTLDKMISGIEHFYMGGFKPSNIERQLLAIPGMTSVKGRNDVIAPLQDGYNTTGDERPVGVTDEAVHRENPCSIKERYQLVCSQRSESNYYSLPFEILEKIFIWVIRNRSELLPESLTPRQENTAFLEASRQCVRESLLRLQALQKSCPFELILRSDDGWNPEHDTLSNGTESEDGDWLVSTLYPFPCETENWVDKDTFYNQSTDLSFGHDVESKDILDAISDHDVEDSATMQNNEMGDYITQNDESIELSSLFDGEDDMPMDQEMLDKYFDWVRTVPESMDDMLYCLKVLQKFSLN